jgi:hypothetical protein
MRLQTRRSAGDPATSPRPYATLRWCWSPQQVTSGGARPRAAGSDAVGGGGTARRRPGGRRARPASPTVGCCSSIWGKPAHLDQAGARDAIHVATHELWRCFDRPIAALVGFCANADVDLTRSLDAPGRITLCSTDDFIVCCCRMAEQGAYTTWPSVAMALRHTMQLMISTHAAMDAAYPDAAV